NINVSVRLSILNKMSDAYPEYIKEFSIEIADYNPISPTGRMPLPETIPKSNNSIINIQNDDDWYFECKYKGRKYLCRYCLKVISTEKGFNEHRANPKKCLGVNNAPQLPKVPTIEKSIKEFNNHKCMQPNPYHIFWDLECLTEKLTPEENTQLIHTKKIQRHKPYGYCYMVIHMDSSLNYEIVSHDLYRGSDTLERFVIKIEEELLSIQEDLSVPAEMIMAPGDLKKAKHRLLEVKEWKACMGKEHQEKKNVIAPDAEIGYMPEVDLEVPIHLQDFFADYPLAPEKQIVPKNWLSLYNERLVHDKEVGALQTYMKFGMKVTKIYSALKFKQSPWIKDYIEENIHKRKIAKANKEEFGVMYYKLKNNTVFEKQMENVCKHIRVELLCSDQDKKLKRELVCLKPKMYSVLPAGHDPNTPKTDEDFEKELENEETRKSWLQAEKDPYAYIKAVAIKIFLDEEAYNQRIENYCK
ncbi:13463_t:CDS:2, partial [Gigaspora margarita]